MSLPDGPAVKLKGLGGCMCHMSAAGRGLQQCTAGQLALYTLASGPQLCCLAAAVVHRLLPSALCR